MNATRKSFFLASADPASGDGLREIVRLVREGWVVVESSPVAFASPAGAATPSAVRGPANVIVLEDRRGMAPRVSARPPVLPVLVPPGRVLPPC